jgi:protein-S-isoprenylcysteine O-methyltransferase Ste14
MPEYRPTRCLPPFWFALAVAAMVALHLALPLARLIPPPWKWVGVLPLLAGLSLTLAAARIFRLRGTGIKPFSPATTLVTSGPYRFTRNPMYLGLVLMLIGLATLLGSLTPWLVIPPFAWWIDRRFIRHEEAMLETHFGQAFADLRRRVRRWL